jgi:hypothetical protein
MVRERGEAYSATQVTLLSHVYYADYGVGNVVVTGFASKRATFGFLVGLRFLEVFEIIVFLGEVVDVWALPMSSRKGAVLSAVLGYLDFAFFHL